uniref:Uncharacterized protein n=1 Tax=Anopheles quadriannulatus TaxID=34691 RepID=A0A182XRE7_ANOQN
MIHFSFIVNFRDSPLVSKFHRQL